MFLDGSVTRVTGSETILLFFSLLNLVGNFTHHFFVPEHIC